MRGMNSMGISDPWANYLKIIALYPGINPIGISAPWSDSLDNIAFHPLKILWGINPMGISSPSAVWSCRTVLRGL